MAAGEQVPLALQAADVSLPDESIAPEKAGEEPDSNTTEQANPSLRMRGCIKKKWSDAKGDMVGSAKRKKSLSAFAIELDAGSSSGSIAYRARPMGGTYQKWRYDGTVAGRSSGKGALDSLAIKLVGPIAQNYDVMYRVRTKGAGWRPWVSGGLAASGGKGNPIVALQVRLVARPGKPTVERTVKDGLYTMSPTVARKLVATPKTSGNALVPILAPVDPSQPAGKLKVTWRGDGYELMNAQSGKVLQAQNSATTLLGRVTYAKRAKSPDQRWAIVKGGSGAWSFVSMSGAVLTATGKSSGKPLGLALARATGKGQLFKLKQVDALSSGTYRLVARSASSGKCATAVAAPKAGIALGRTKDAFGERFSIRKSKRGYVIQSVSTGKYVTAKGRKAYLRSKIGSRRQLWKAEVATGGGVRLVNAATGKALSCNRAKAGSRVVQAKASTKRARSSWRLSQTKFNKGDEQSFLRMIRLAKGRSLHFSNVPPDYKVNKKAWRRLKSALNDCWDSGIGVGFVMLDLKSGAVLTCNPDAVIFGASTIKGLYTSYLFEEHIAKGSLSWSQISSLAWPAIVNSDNDAYRSLRALYGSEGGFASWLSSVDVGYLGVWDYFSPRVLAKTWTHMQDYSTSGKRGAGTWKSLFNHSYYSVIHETLGGKKKTYTKPGWTSAASSRGPILNDAGIVDAGKGDRYILAIMTTRDGFASHRPIQEIVKAIDSIQKRLPKDRG